MLIKLKFNHLVLLIKIKLFYLHFFAGILFADKNFTSSKYSHSAHRDLAS